MTHDTHDMYCECTPVCDTRFGGEGGRSVTVAVVEAVAAAENVAPTELDPLTEHVDLEALHKLLETSSRLSGGTTTVRTTIRGWNVFVRSDGMIRVCDPDPQVDAEPVFEREVEC